MPAPRGADDDDEPTARPQVVFAGRYLLLHELGRGGMGVVWVAYDKEQMRGVALKQISKERQDDAGLRERFRREYRALGAVRHPGVPTLYTDGRAPDGTPYFTMELIRGETLHRALQSAPLDPVWVLDVAIELGKILMAVHAVGIVHRDVKPSNIIIEPGGRVRLIDFGACLPLPNFYKRDGIGPVTATAARWGTGEHEIIGTPAYTDPAAMYEKQTTARADSFSGGTIEYEAITARYRVDRTSQKIHPIQTGAFPPQLGRLAAELRRGTDPVVSRRHHSMAELVHALEAIRTDLLRGRMQVAPPQRSRIARPMASAFALASASALLLYMAGRSLFDRAPDDASVRAASVDPVGADAIQEPSRPAAHEIVAESVMSGLAACDAPEAPAPEVLAGLDERQTLAARAARETDISAEADAGREPGSPRPSAASDTSRPPPPATIAAVLRAARPSLRACRVGGTSLTVQIVVQAGRAAVVSLDDDPPDEHGAFRCVAGALARFDFPDTRTPVFRTLAL